MGIKNTIKRINEASKHLDVDPLGEENWEEPKKVETICGEKVKVYVMLSGDYCAFHEISLNVVFDITNDHSVGYHRYTKEELDNWDFNKHRNYSIDVDKYDAIKVGNRYYVKL